MSDWPLLSLVIFLPLAGAAFIMLIRGEPEVVAQNARAVALWTSGITFLLSLLIFANFDPATPRFPAGRAGRVVRRLQHQLPRRRRRHLAVVRDPQHPAHAALRDQLLVLDPDPHQGVHGRVPDHGHLHGRRVLRPRHGAVLHVLRGHPDPDVPDHRHLGRAEPGLLGLQVLPLHAFGLGAVPGRDPGAVLPRGHHRHPDADGGRLRPDAAEVAVARDVRLVRGQGPDVAVPHLAAGRACRGADRGLDPSGGRAAEARRLRLPALLAADAAGRLGVLHAADLHALRRRGDLHLAGRPDAGGHEEADRLLLDRPYGPGHDRHLHAQCASASTAASSRC